MQSIRDTGRKTNLMVKGIMFMPMEMNTKVSWLRTSAMDMVSGPLGRKTNHMKVIGSTISSVEKVSISMITVMCMLVSFIKIINMEKERLPGKMEEAILGNIRMISNMVMVLINGLWEKTSMETHVIRHIKVNGVMVINMARDV